MKSYQIPEYANEPVEGLASLNGVSAGALGTDTNGTAVIAAAERGTRVHVLIATTDDVVAIDLFVYTLNDDGITIKPIGLVNVPANSGNAAGIPQVDILSGLDLPLDYYGNKYLDIALGNTLKVSTVANMSAPPTKCFVTALAKNFIEE